MSLSPAELAVLNNITWYQAMFAARGIASETDAVAWQSDETPPAFHSHLVVRAKHASQVDIEARLRRIDSRPRPSGWGLKDSYANLDLEHLGFLTLFNVSWLWRAPEDAAPPVDDGDII